MQTVTIRLDSLEKVKIPLGFVGENLHRRVIFVCDSMFKQYPSAVAALAIVNPAGVMYPGILTREGNNVLWDIRDSDVAVEGNGEIQLTFTEDTHVAKEYKCKTHITESIVSNSPAPDPVQDWLDYASGLIDGIPDDIAAALAEAKASGEFDGVGIASIAKTGTSGLVDTYTITLDNGESYDFTVTNGQKGDDGVGIQSIVKTSTSGLVDTYTITLTNGQTSEFTVTNGRDGVQIDDTTPASNKVFSSSKVAEMNTQLLNAIEGIEDAVIVEKAIHENEDISAQLSYDANTYVTDAGYRGSSTSYKCTEKIPVTEGMIFKTTYQTDWRYVCAYNGDTVITAKGGANLSTYTVPAGITHIIITLYSTVNTGSRAVIKQFDKEWIENNLTDELKATEADLDSVKSATTEKTVTQKETDLSTKISYITGQYINKTGYNGADASYNRTNKISVKEGEVYKTSYQTDWRFVCAYEGETAVSDKGAEYVRTYTVPEGVTHIVITLASSVSLTQRAIIKVDPFVDYENSASKIVPSFVQRGARVTFIDDDGYAEFYTHFKPIMQEYGIPMCPAYMGDVCPTFVNATYMTEEQCKEIVSIGGEILVHGGTNLTTLTFAQAEANVLASKNALMAHGFKSDVYVYPNSGNNIAIREMMARHFKCAFKTGYPQKDDTRVNDKCVPHYFIHRCSAGGYYDDKSADYGNYDTYTLDYFKALVDDAIAKKGWLVFMTHAWMMPIGCSYRLEHDTANGIPADLDEFALIEDIIEYIQTKKNNGDDIEIVTASEGFEMFGNEVQAGDYLGYWNETYTGLNQYEHSKAGFAVNKLGDIDFADGNRISHS